MNFKYTWPREIPYNCNFNLIAITISELSFAYSSLIAKYKTFSQIKLLNIDETKTKHTILIELYQLVLVMHYGRHVT